MTTVDERERWAYVAIGCLAEPGRKDIYHRVLRDGPVGAALGIANDNPRITGGPDGLWALARDRLAEADRLGARIIVPTDDEWPAFRLDDLARISRTPQATATGTVDRDTYPPMCIWLRGAQPLSEAVAKSVAIVGARACTPYGEHVAAELGYGLAAKGYTVVSGGAFGIDAAAHRGALAAGGPTIAVLACGVDKAYPMSHATLLERVAEAGLVLSEWPPGSNPLRFRFLVRNRVIAALTRGTVMVEAAARSGSRQTLHRAMQLGRAAMAVPGPVTSALSVGCHDELRKMLVQPVASVAHVLEEVGRIGDDLADPAVGPARPHDGLDDIELRLMDAVPARTTVLLGAIVRESGVPVRDAMAKLPALVTRGLLIEEAGRYRLP
jgi:DNA processing protein